MPRLLAIAAIVIALYGCAVASADGTAAHEVYVERSIVGQELAYRPHAIGLSADGTFAIIGISYQNYGRPVATATGQAYVRGCTPNCAEGREFRVAARLRFSDQIRCRGVTIYSRLHYTLNRPLPAGFRRRGYEPLRPVGKKGC